MLGEEQTCGINPPVHFPKLP